MGASQSQGSADKMPPRTSSAPRCARVGARGASFRSFRSEHVVYDFFPLFFISEIPTKKTKINPGKPGNQKGVIIRW